MCIRDRSLAGHLTRLRDQQRRSLAYYMLLKPEGTFRFLCSIYRLFFIPVLCRFPFNKTKECKFGVSSLLNDWLGGSLNGNKDDANTPIKITVFVQHRLSNIRTWKDFPSFWLVVNSMYQNTNNVIWPFKTKNRIKVCHNFSYSVMWIPFPYYMYTRPCVSEAVSETIFQFLNVIEVTVSLIVSLSYWAI